MKVLWFEVTIPSKYKDESIVIGGWQDSLEAIVKMQKDIELYIAFEGTKDMTKKIIDGVTYLPIPTKSLSFWERKRDLWSWAYNEHKVVEGALEVINNVNPDLIHIFGMEWSWAAVVPFTKVPCVVHIMGSIVPYYNALFPPKYSERDFYKEYAPNPLKMFNYFMKVHKLKTWRQLEQKKWKHVRYYMGRTEWDRALCNTLSPNSQYYHVEEAIRPCFFSADLKWRTPVDAKIRIFSTGCGSFWKGPDMMLKTAVILTSMKIDFEWFVAGKFADELRHVVERKEGATFDDNNIKFLGFLQPQELSRMLCNSTMYVHTAYIDNSPNSICEAQIMGVPVVSTNVGGIESLVGRTGKLVPANDPWQMANVIVELAKNKVLMCTLSEKAREKALLRHDKDRILKQLISCYEDLLNRHS